MALDWTFTTNGPVPYINGAIFVKGGKEYWLSREETGFDYDPKTGHMSMSWNDVYIVQDNGEEKKFKSMKELDDFFEDAQFVRFEIEDDQPDELNEEFFPGEKYFVRDVVHYD